jgi:hypothetical protein
VHIPLLTTSARTDDHESPFERARFGFKGISRSPRERAGFTKMPLTRNFVPTVG